MDSSNFIKLCLNFALLVATLQNADAGCPSKEWRPYKEEKCIRVLDLLSNHSDAELTCQEQNSTLLSIASAEEQEFLDHFIFSDLGTVDNVWLGAVRVNSTTFQWTDGSPWTFENWKEGSPSDIEGDDCGQMVSRGGRKNNLITFDPSLSGLWSNVACGKRNLVVCQRTPTFSLEELTALFLQHRQTSETQIKEQEQKLADADRELKQVEMKLAANTAQLEEANSKILQVSQSVEKNPVPLGFVYTQLAGQPEPSVIWPTVTWTQVTQDYAGLFFRAEGGNSSTFGQVQKDESPRLSRVVFSERLDGITVPRDIMVPERGASEFVYVGSDDMYFANNWQSYRFFLSFHNSGGEVRPINQAIRLWKRTA